MANDMLEAVSPLAPDHGHGRLGQTVHTALVNNLEGGVPYPRLFFAHNTMADPPIPISSYLGNSAQDEQAWSVLGGRLDTYLQRSAEQLAAAPIPPEGTFGEEHLRLARMNRIDSLLLVVRAHMMRPAHDAGAQAIYDNLLEGYFTPEDLDASPAATEVTTVMAVDRGGHSLMMWAPASAAADTDNLAGNCHTELPQPVAEGMSAVLAAQYTWTTTVFGPAAG